MALEAEREALPTFIHSHRCVGVWASVILYLYVRACAQLCVCVCECVCVLCMRVRLCGCFVCVDARAF